MRCSSLALALLPGVAGFGALPSGLNPVISVASVNGVAERKTPEPYKPTQLCALPGCEENPNVRVCWSMQLGLPADQIAPLPSVLHHECVSGTTYTYTFTHPGEYIVSADLEGSPQSAQATLRNVYARREVRQLTSSEWQAWVDALWTLATTSTALGRARFTCPSGRQEDYHEHAYFVMIHGALSANSTCDQLHFSMMQEFAHQGWNTMLERAMQCVDPSVALVWWDEAADRRNFGDDDADDVSASLLNSPIWSSEYMGGRANYEGSAINPHAYVQDGKFANFPLRQNRTGLCDEAHFPELKTLCEGFIEVSNYAWRGPKESTGFWWTEPRPLGTLDENDGTRSGGAYDYVSRRTAYVMNMRKHSYDKFVTDNDVNWAVNQESFVDAIDIVTGDTIHGFAHYWVSGVWEPGNGLSTSTLQAVAAGPTDAWVWPFDTRLRQDGCIVCPCESAPCDTCQCAVDSQSRGCWDNDITTPSDTFDADTTNYPPKQGSWWRTWLEYTRGAANARKNAYGCELGVSGTFQRSTVANQDPVFYLHHAFTFVVVERAMRRQRDYAAEGQGGNYRPPPFYGLDEYFNYGEWERECPGNNLYDVSPFNHLVPYTTGQAVGSRHTWEDILRQWDFSKRHYRWVLEGET